MTDRIGPASPVSDEAGGQGVGAIGYVRVSTTDQAESGLGVESQKSRIRAYCEMKGLELRTIVLDLGVSGGKPLQSRPGGSELLRHVDGILRLDVVVLKLDRAFRNAADCLATVEKWDRAGIGLHIVDLGGSAIDSTSAAGKFMLTVLAGAAEMERNLTRERTRAALAVKRARGHRISRTPYGFDLEADGITLVQNKKEQTVIGEVLAMRKRGMSMPKIARRLTERSIPTKRGASEWRHETIAGLLKRHGNAGSKSL